MIFMKFWLHINNGYRIITTKIFTVNNKRKPHLPLDASIKKSYLAIGTSDLSYKDKIININLQLLKTYRNSV